MQNIFRDFDFRKINSKDFKEDSVREVLILPILKALGYNNDDIVRSKNLLHPFLKIGSQKRPISLIPDYLLKVRDNYAWVLDAKGPEEEIKYGNNVEQIYSYSIHPEVRTKYFALCNGRNFILFRQDEEKPLLFFPLKDINKYWNKLEYYLSPESFQIGKRPTYDDLVYFPDYVREEADYMKKPLLDEIKVTKQSVKRHFGVHGYFTRQAWNVVHDYIKNFTKAGDLVLDPFGGTGVTSIEALMLGRKAINIDLNPMSVFMVESLIAPVNLKDFLNSFEQIRTTFKDNTPTRPNEIKEALKKYKYPKGLVLPRGSDVDTIEKLFSEKQLAQLAYLKYLIKKEKNENIRQSLLLAFSSTITKINLTYHSSKTRDENAGDSAPFRYYRYRLASKKVELDVLRTFETKFKKVLNAKKEIQYKINEKSVQDIQIVRGTAINLSFIKKETVDYIYTDPPYGSKIPYLDLSVMWNGWLDLKVTDKDFEMEAIEGGRKEKSKANYNELIAKSIEEMYRVLKFDRWMSFVFAHKDPEFWHLIIDTAEKCGFEYAGAIKQSNGQSSFKKRQNPFTVLSGQLIINFKKVKKPKAILKANLGANIGDIVLETIEGVIAQHHGATLEQINDELIIKGLELGFLDLLKKEYSDLTSLLLSEFDYSEKTQLFTIKKNTKFKTHVDEKLRIRYYLLSYLKRAKNEGKSPNFDDIILEIMPLLKNGKTPENQTISKVLNDIGERVGEGDWQISRQQRLFD